MTNIDYFLYSVDNADDIIDFSNPKGVIVINKNEDEAKTELVIANEKLLGLIISYKTICENKNLKDEKIIDAILDEIIGLLKSVRNINYSAFCSYFQVLGYSYYAYKESFNNLTTDENRELIRSILDLYLENRHNIYTFHGYSNIVLQVSSDISSSRRKGKTGIVNMEDMLRVYNINHIYKYNDLDGEGTGYLLPDKGDKNEFNYFLDEQNIKFDFRKTRDDKLPDMLLKIKSDIFIIEHKLTNGSGGSQNAEINEIIQFVNYSEKSNKVHFVSCLQGNYFKRLKFDSTEPKTKTQYQNIFNALNGNPNNYFVNGKGFEKLVASFI